MYALERSRVLSHTPYGELIVTSSDTDGNCFFHSYLQSTEQETYSSYSKEKRLQRVASIRDYIDKKLSPSDIYELVDPVSFEAIQNVIDRWLTKHKYEPIVFHSDKMSIRGYVEEIDKKYPGVIKDEHFISHIHELIQYYGKEIRSYFRKNGTWMNDSLIPLFGKIMKVDILFISSRTNKPISLALRGGYQHVLIMYHSGDHFESMGIVTKTDILRVFTPDAILKLFPE